MAGDEYEDGVKYGAREEEIHLNASEPGNGGSRDRAESGESIALATASDLANGDTNGSDSAGTVMQRTPHTPYVGPAEHRIRQWVRGDGLPVTPPAEELPNSWRKQNVELNSLLKGYEDLEGKYGRLGTEKEDKDRELRNVYLVKNQLECKIKSLEEGWGKRDSAFVQLERSYDQTRHMALGFEKEVREVKANYDNLSEFNNLLRAEWTAARNALKAKDKAFEELRKQAKKWEDDLLSRTGLEAELKKLKDDLTKCHQENGKLVAQRREWRMEPRKPRAATLEGEKTLGPLEDEIQGTESVDAGDHDEEVEHTPVDAADSTTGTHAWGPDGKADKTSTDTPTDNSPFEVSAQFQEADAEADKEGTSTQRVELTSAEGEKSCEKSNDISTFMQTGDSATSGAETDNTVKDSRRPQSEFRFGTAELPALESTVNDAVSQTTPKAAGVEGDEKNSEDGGQKEELQTQGRTVEGNSNTEQGKGSEARARARAIPYLSMAWWMLLLCVALGWWCFGREDKQLWMQANELTRQTVIGLRDERWARPMWLARMSFDAENLLGIDRSMSA